MQYCPENTLENKAQYISLELEFVYENVWRVVFQKRSTHGLTVPKILTSSQILVQIYFPQPLPNSVTYRERDWLI